MGEVVVMIQQCLSTEQFLAARPDYPESGQWAELVEGIPVFLEPPDLDHGTVVLNLSKRLALYFSREPAGYACFDLGLQLETGPDTVLFPAVSVYLHGERFAHSDEEVSRDVPDLVIEILSTPDRRQQASQRIRRYQHWGVKSVWQINSRAQTVAIHHLGMEPIHLTTTSTLTDGDVLPGFSMEVIDLFAEPEWYRGSR